MKIYFLLFSLLVSGWLQAQLNANLIIGTDLYQNLKNPKIQGNTYGRSSGAVGTLNLGFQIEAGKKDFSIGLDAQTNFSAFALNINEYKGLGSICFPMMLKINSGVCSGFSQKLTGFAIGAGVQFNRTELFGLTEKYNQLNRKYFPCYVAEIDIAGGVGGLCLYYFIRIGIGEEKSRTINTGLNFRIDFTKKNSFKIKPNPLST